MLCVGTALLSKFRCLGGRCTWPGLNMLWMLFLFSFPFRKIEKCLLVNENVRSASPSPTCLGKWCFALCKEELGLWRPSVHSKGLGVGSTPVSWHLGLQLTSGSSWGVAVWVDLVGERHTAGRRDMMCCGPYKQHLMVHRGSVQGWRAQAWLCGYLMLSIIPETTSCPILFPPVSAIVPAFHSHKSQLSLWDICWGFVAVQEAKPGVSDQVALGLSDCGSSVPAAKLLIKL